ncbi:MAG: cupin domain-containing protein [Thermoleophilia bacterium]|nr:cupin domain-containing protein [Thermoleophilia bacterium]
MFNLAPHPEGGYFRETMRLGPERETPRGPRSLVTTALYLLVDGEPSRFHRLWADEFWLFHAGAPAEVIILPPRDEEAKEGGRGPGEVSPGMAELDIRPLDIAHPQVHVPAGSWQAARVRSERLGARDPADESGAQNPADKPAAQGLADKSGALGPINRARPNWTLVTCVVVPGFDFADFVLADRAALEAQFPAARALIAALT